MCTSCMGIGFIGSEVLLNELDENWIRFYSSDDRDGRGNKRSGWNCSWEMKFGKFKERMCVRAKRLANVNITV